MPDEIIPTGTAHAGQAGDDAMAALMTLVLDDETLQSRLGEIEAPALYASELLDIAMAHGIVLDAEAIHAATRPDPLGVGRWMPSPVNLDRWPSRGWLPTRVAPTGGAPAIDWAWFGDHRLDAPFYEDSVRRFATRPFSLMFRTRTSMETLVAGLDPVNGPVPDGLIHHMSRCGSTLLATMLASDPSHVVLSEPGPLDDVLRWAVESNAPIAFRIAAIRAIVAALGRNRTGATRRLFVKLDSWHAVALPLLREAFPDTAWVYLYREPVEVLVSQVRQRGSNTVPGLLPASVLGIAGGEAMDAERYVALALARFSEAILDNWDVGGGLLVNYAELPDAAIARVAPHFGLTLGGDARTAMAAAALRDAKAPEKPFLSDAARKQDEATSPIRTAAQDILGPVHERLNAIRNGPSKV